MHCDFGSLDVLEIRKFITRQIVLPAHNGQFTPASLWLNRCEGEQEQTADNSYITDSIYNSIYIVYVVYITDSSYITGSS